MRHKNGYDYTNTHTLLTLYNTVTRVTLDASMVGRRALRLAHRLHRDIYPQGLSHRHTRCTGNTPICGANQPTRGNTRRRVPP